MGHTAWNDTDRYTLGHVSRMSSLWGNRVIIGLDYGQAPPKQMIT